MPAIWILRLIAAHPLHLAPRLTPFRRNCLPDRCPRTTRLCLGAYCLPCFQQNGWARSFREGQECGTTSRACKDREYGIRALHAKATASRSGRSGSGFDADLSETPDRLTSPAPPTISDAIESLLTFAPRVSLSLPSMVPRLQKNLLQGAKCSLRPQSVSPAPVPEQISLSHQKSATQCQFSGALTYLATIVYVPCSRRPPPPCLSAPRAHGRRSAPSAAVQAFTS